METLEKRCRGLWVKQFLTLKYFARVFSLKSIPYNFVGNEGIYSVCKEFRKALFIFAKQRVSQAVAEPGFQVRRGKI